MQEDIFSPKKFAEQMLNAENEQQICSIKKLFSNYDEDQKINLLLEFLDLASGKKIRIQTIFKKLGDFPQLRQFLLEFKNSCIEFQRLNTIFNEAEEENSNESAKQSTNFSWKENSVAPNNYSSSQSFMFVQSTSNTSNTNSPTFAGSREPCNILPLKPRRYTSDNE